MKLRIAIIAVAVCFTAGAVLYLHLRQSGVEDSDVNEIPTQQEPKIPKRGSPIYFPKTVVAYQKPFPPALPAADSVETERRVKPQM